HALRFGRMMRRRIACFTFDRAREAIAPQQRHERRRADAAGGELKEIATIHISPPVPSPCGRGLGGGFRSANCVSLFGCTPSPRPSPTGRRSYSIHVHKLITSQQHSAQTCPRRSFDAPELFSRLFEIRLCRRLFIRIWFPRKAQQVHSLQSF